MVNSGIQNNCCDTFADDFIEHVWSMSRHDLKRKQHKGRRKVGSRKRRNKRRIRLGLKVRKK